MGEPAIRLARPATALLAGFVLLYPRIAAAREEEPRVLVWVSPDVAEARAVRFVSAVTGQLRDVAAVDAGDARAGSPPTCVVMIEGGEQGLVLRFADANGESLSEPRSVTEPRDELAASEVATIVRAFVVARMASTDTRPVVASAPTEPPIEPPAAAAPLPEPMRERDRASPADTGLDRSLTAWRGWLSAFYTGTAYAPELGWQNGVGLEVGARINPWLYAGVGYVFHPPVEVASELASVRLSSHDFAAFLGLGRSWRAWAAAGEIGFGLSDIARVTQSLAPQLAGSPEATLLSAAAILRLRVRVRVPQVPRLTLDVAPAVELVAGTHALVIESLREATLLSPNLVRARIDAGASFALF